MKRHCVVKVLLAIWEIFLHENSRNYTSYRVSNKFSFVPYLTFIAKQKKESGVQQVSGLVTGNISVFCLKRVTLYLKAIPNSIDFYKGIFVHVVPVRIIALCFNKKWAKRYCNFWLYFVYLYPYFLLNCLSLSFSICISLFSCTSVFPLTSPW